MFYPHFLCDSQSKIQGVGFLKIHAPWNVLCREAELMKLKMPTKRVRMINVSFCVISRAQGMVGLTCRCERIYRCMKSNNQAVSSRRSLPWSVKFWSLSILMWKNLRTGTSSTCHTPSAGKSNTCKCVWNTALHRCSSTLTTLAACFSTRNSRFEPGPAGFSLGSRGLG